MKKSKKNLIINIMIILAVIIIAIILLIINRPNPNKTSEEIAKCIGSKSVLYTQLGCHYCKNQEDMFGENYKYLNVIDCWYDNRACVENNITGTPSWIIKGKKYSGVQTIEKLQELTGC
jgi:hypothetical protein